MASASATAKSTIIQIEKAAMIRVLHEQPAMAELFMAFLLSRNIQIEADLVDQLFNSSERRLARLLLLLANFGKEGKMETVIPTINQDVLAARVGTTRSRINFFMNKFRKLGFIEYNGGLKIHTSLLNVIVHD
jgi:CRP-like cAMP-binding protein